MNQISAEVRHFFHRAGFGVGMPELSNSIKKSIAQLADDEIQAALLPLETDSYGSGLPVRDQSPFATRDQIQMSDTTSSQVDRLRAKWVESMIDTRTVLAEKMTLFWHGHFACQCNTENVAKQYLNIIRTNALGNFRTLLHEIARSPAMIIFLNNLQNRQDHPNENFARELMELFTMGRANYSERDVSESARAFTGWSVDQQGYFFYREQNHDSGLKEFLGRKGSFDGDEIINIILDQPATAHHLAHRLYRYFVNEKIDAQAIQQIARVIRDVDYNMAEVMHFLLTSDFFYLPQNQGNRIKSPLELLVQVARIFGLRYVQPTQLAFLQKALGQLLFDPPNVAGWPGGRDWINNSTLMLRLNLVRYLIHQERFDHSVSTPLEAMAAGESIQIVEIEQNYQPLLDYLSGTRYDQMEKAVQNLLIAGSNQAPEMAKSKDFRDLDFSLQVILKTTSLPEFQMS